MIELIKHLVETNAARLVAYGGAIALALASQVAKALGVELPPEVVTGIQAIGVFVATELIRRLVFAKQTVEQTADAAFQSGYSAAMDPAP